MGTVVNPLTQERLEHFVQMAKEKKLDLYKLLAQSMFDVSYESVTAEQRTVAKEHAFMFVYASKAFANYRPTK